MRATLLAWLVATAGMAQIPAPRMEWMPYQKLGSCGGAVFSASISKDDGRNGFDVKFKIENTTEHRVSARYEATFLSEEGATARRMGGSRLNPHREYLEPGSETPVFETPVNRPLPVHIRQLTLSVVETANIDVLPPYAGDSVYLNDFRDFPKETCHDLSITFGGALYSRMIGLTETCYNGLPQWQPACNQAVDEIVRIYPQAPGPAQSCLQEWRRFQKCYEAYAYGTHPDPTPSCVDKIPHCDLP